jgi:hypothetical protein
VAVARGEVPLDDVKATALKWTPEGPVLGGVFHYRLDIDGVRLRSGMLPSQFVIAFDEAGHHRWSFVSPSGLSKGLPLLSRTRNGVAAIYGREEFRADRPPDFTIACFDVAGKVRSESRIPFPDEPLSFTPPVFDGSIQLVAVTRSGDSATIQKSCEGVADVEMNRGPASSFLARAVTRHGPSLLIAGCRPFNSGARCIAEVRCTAGSRSETVKPLDRRDPQRPPAESAVRAPPR